MRSLQARLLAAVSLTIFCGWAIWFGYQFKQMTAQQSGHWDRSLRSVAEQILLSLPRDVDTLVAGDRLQLADEARTIAGKFDKLHFQAWLPASGRLVFASPQAPPTPMRRDFGNGFALVGLDDERWRVFSVTDSTGTVQVQVGHDTSLMRAEIAGWLRGSAATALLVLAGLALALWGVVRWSLKPVRRVQAAIAAREALDLTPLAGAGLPCEVRPLVDSFNDLLARLERALQRERQFLGEAAHELRTPLAALLTQAQVAQHSTGAEESREALERLVRGIERTSRLAQQLLDSARVETARADGERAPVDLSDVAGMVAREFELVAARKRQRIALDTVPCPVEGNLDDLGILVRNLIDNALRYGPDAGRVAIRCRPSADAASAVLSVRDDGPGVAAGERARIFERFVRGSNGNGERGSGLGLSLVSRVASAHGATLRIIDGLDGRGFGVELAFPLRASA